MLRALGQDFVISCRRWLTIEPRLLLPIVPWLTAAGERVFLLIRADNLEALLWRVAALAFAVRGMS